MHRIGSTQFMLYHQRKYSIDVGKQIIAITFISEEKITEEEKTMSNETVKETEYNEKLMKLAKKRVALKKSIFIHLTSYIIINIFLVAIYYLVMPGGYFWPIWSIMGWGVGLVIHGIVVMYLLSSLSGTQDSTMKEYERLVRDQGNK